MDIVSIESGAALGVVWLLVEMVRALIPAKLVNLDGGRVLALVLAASAAVTWAFDTQDLGLTEDVSFAQAVLLTFASAVAANEMITKIFPSQPIAAFFDKISPGVG